MPGGGGAGVAEGPAQREIAISWKYILKDSINLFLRNILLAYFYLGEYRAKETKSSGWFQLFKLSGPMSEWNSRTRMTTAKCTRARAPSHGRWAEGSSHPLTAWLAPLGKALRPSSLVPFFSSSFLLFRFSPDRQVWPRSGGGQKEGAQRPEFPFL